MDGTEDDMFWQNETTPTEDEKDDDDDNLQYTDTDFQWSESDFQKLFESDSEEESFGFTEEDLTE
jgi:hypothetical protein